MKIWKYTSRLEKLWMAWGFLVQFLYCSQLEGFTVIEKLFCILSGIIYLLIFFKIGRESAYKEEADKLKNNNMIK